MPERLGRLTLVATLAAAIGISAVQPAAAVGGVPDDGAFRIPDTPTFSAMVGDVNGDGANELVRLVAWETNPAQQAVEVLSIRGGAALPRGQVLVQRAATPDDTFAGRRPTPDNLLPVDVNEPVRLLRWHVNGQERVLLVSIGTDGLARACCLTVWQVELVDGRTTLRFIQDTSASAESILVSDMDQDGTDELVILETVDPSLAMALIRRVLVLRWNGTDFDRRYADAQPSALSGPLIPLGDTDGLPGSEVGFVEVARGGELTPTLFRIRLDENGQPSVQHGLLPAEGELAVLPGEPGDGDALVMVDPQVVRLLRWDATGFRVEVAATVQRGGVLMGVLGSGLGARLLVERGGAVDVLDRELRSVAGINASTPATRFVGTDFPPYLGPLYTGAPNGDDALVFDGQLIHEDDTRPTSLAVRQVGVMPGLVPIGRVGAGGESLVMAKIVLTLNPLVELVPADPRGGWLVPSHEEPAPGGLVVRMWVAPAEQALRPEAGDGALEPMIEGGVSDPRRAVPTLLTRAGLLAVFRAPGDATATTTGVSADPLALQPEGTEMRVPLTDESGKERSYVARLLVATPGGHGYWAQWQVRVIRSPLSLSAAASDPAWSFRVTVSGRTDPGASVEVDGAQASVAADGTFSAPVEAGLVPRAVTVRAWDPLGRTAENRVSVVAPYDYRTLPWIPIIAALTVLVALVLFLRAPRPRPGQTADAGTLEDLD